MCVECVALLPRIEPRHINSVVGQSLPLLPVFDPFLTATSMRSPPTSDHRITEPDWGNVPLIAQFARRRQIQARSDVAIHDVCLYAAGGLLRVFVRCGTALRWKA